MQYRPLDETKNEIRVLRFLDVSSPISAEDAINCSLEHVPLEFFPQFQSHQENPQVKTFPVAWDVFTTCVDLRDSTLEQTRLDKATHTGIAQNHSYNSGFRYAWGDFEALSYTWGDGGDTRCICVNGTDIDIPINLENALRALRNLKETRLGMSYWVDWLCINQQDVEERNKQVKRMKDIYGRARAVVVWLGQEEETDSDAVKTMHFLCRNPSVENILELPGNLLLKAWPALLAFTKKIYWTRSWIIQELAVNHNSTSFLCGRFKLTRRMIRLGALYCQEVLKDTEEWDCRSDTDLGQDEWSLVNRMHRLVSLALNPNFGISLDRLSSLIRWAKASCDKDKVYSVLGLLDPMISADLIPDYSLSEQQIFTEFTTSVVKNRGDISYIMVGGIPTSKGWPSWVPDWRQPFLRYHIHYFRRFAASGGLPTELRFEKGQENESLLICSGFCVDTVNEVAAETSQIQHSTQLSNNTSPNRYGDLTRQALHQTILLGYPGLRKEPLFRIPWIQEPDTYSNSDNHLGDQEQLKLFQSRNYKRFHKFREGNKHFHAGGQDLQSFFPQYLDRKPYISKIAKIMSLASISLEQRTLITTSTGYLGLAPIAVRRGDVVAILFGSKCPMILRPVGDYRFQVVGECYIHGLMNGEILSHLSDGNVAQREFVLC
ncbi:hypothetical protein COCC4DRAFT_53978 [Bipolaris maydis ATCC 48331]|uniref:Heterokaryon incompatibility domain-containing protein n=2 Tax=Cochliobolus heterostrophus TaxID=5016 RepID=M2TBZ8_COCH5|nr:uncharacterized protein COCC4DRAFT_53978 [Bipolaris maydis ATCC 48331]EMD95085.1 hypothetical protein COCHEDRAFT_1168651 [Bipolaris maydis C5]KAH7555763.1 hypothetical protein BM1_06289 [Bipolaris maydis]ENI00103.1 hypothetical protein COCC4DRAFT_53978 [Bipolaris maydis ATCC 48331]KAJ5029461.1 heterokaryon incompatibility protein-domain-containing protein [Bipolaris maydis]KAJ6214765.1 heterokaryon incompatibility protein-domain-containing protein [Bipolaris maydis]